MQDRVNGASKVDSHERDQVIVKISKVGAIYLFYFIFFGYRLVFLAAQSLLNKLIFNSEAPFTLKCPQMLFEIGDGYIDCLYRKYYCNNVAKKKDKTHTGAQYGNSMLHSCVKK